MSAMTKTKTKMADLVGLVRGLIAYGIRPTAVLRETPELLEAITLAASPIDDASLRARDMVDAMPMAPPLRTKDEARRDGFRRNEVFAAAPDTKPSNPKDIIGSTKVPLELAPDTIEAEVALAYLEGALKYGRFNWRIAGVRSSIYRAAMRRHLMQWWNGEDRDRKTRVRHLASIIASAGILLDAELCGKLEDDRPPRAPITDLLDGQAEIVAHLKELFKDHHPYQYTIADSETP